MKNSINVLLGLLTFFSVQSYGDDGQSSISKNSVFWATTMASNQHLDWPANEPCDPLNKPLLVVQQRDFAERSINHSGSVFSVKVFAGYLISSDKTSQCTYTKRTLEKFESQLTELGQRVTCPESLCKEGTTDLKDDIKIFDESGKINVTNIAFFSKGYAVIAGNINYCQNEINKNDDCVDEDQDDNDFMVTGRVIRFDVQNPEAFKKQLLTQFK